MVMSLVFMMDFARDDSCTNLQKQLQTARRNLQPIKTPKSDLKHLNLNIYNVIQNDNADCIRRTCRPKVLSEV